MKAYDVIQWLTALNKDERERVLQVVNDLVAIRAGGGAPRTTITRNRPSGRHRISCAKCGKRVLKSRKDARFCSKKCIQDAYVERKAKGATS